MFLNCLSFFLLERVTFLKTEGMKVNISVALGINSLISVTSSTGMHGISFQ